MDFSAVPADEDSLFGYMKGTLRVDGDVMAPLDLEWSALSGDEDHLYCLPPASESWIRPGGQKAR